MSNIFTRAMPTLLKSIGQVSFSHRYYTLTDFIVVLNTKLSWNFVVHEDPRHTIKKFGLAKFIGAE